MTDRVEIPIQPTKPAVTATDILKELQLSGVFDHMRAQALQQVVEKERSTAETTSAAPEQPSIKSEPAAVADEHSEDGAQEQPKSPREPEPVPAIGKLQKRVREVAAAALASAPPGASKGAILKQMREAVAAEGLYAALSAMVDSVLENDDAFQSGLVAAVQEATAEAVRPHKRQKTSNNTSITQSSSDLSSLPVTPPPTS